MRVKASFWGLAENMMESIKTGLLATEDVETNECFDIKKSCFFLLGNREERIGLTNEREYID